MKCETIQNQLLSLADVNRVSPELRGHLDGCSACQAFLVRLGQLDQLLTDLPIPPSSEEVKAAFLEQITEAGPVIKRIPVVPRQDSLSSATLRALTQRGRWRYVAGLAASLLIGFGTWLMLSGKKPQPATEIAGPRHELLRRVVAVDVALAKAETPQKRLEIWADVTADLRDEVRLVHKHAPSEDMKALASMFEKATRQGLLKQAALLPEHLPADQRQALVRDVTKKLTDAEEEANRLAQEAPQQSQMPLRQMARTAHDVRIKLEKQVNGKGV